MRKIDDLIACTNLQCASNGGTNASKLLSTFTPPSARNGNRPIEPEQSMEERLNQLVADEDVSEMCGACTTGLRMDIMHHAVASMPSSTTTQKLLQRADAIFYWVIAGD
jgi:hypothetical protein